MRFDDRELQYIKDQEFLLAKNTIIRKVHELLEEARADIRGALGRVNLPMILKGKFKTDKISRGENYCGLPYLVLDYPAVYDKKNIFAFRTMFWWGNFFSTTFHLQGSFLDQYRSAFKDQIAVMARDHYFICVGETPWEYHYQEDNYRTLVQSDVDVIDSLAFLKLSKKHALDEWNSLPQLATKFVVDMLTMLK